MKLNSINQASSKVSLKNVFILTLLTLSVISVQGQAFQKNDKLISPGIGLGLRSNSGIGPTIPLVINADIGILDFYVLEHTLAIGLVNGTICLPKLTV